MYNNELLHNLQSSVSVSLTISLLHSRLSVTHRINSVQRRSNKTLAALLALIFAVLFTLQPVLAYHADGLITRK